MQLISRALFYSALFYGLLFQPLTAAQLSAPPLCPPARINETARVAHVHDGDTLKLTDGRKIRLIGINTPELARKNQPAEAYAYVARDALRKLIDHSNATVGLNFGNQRHDKYQRTLAHLFMPDGTNIQASMLQQGYATAFTTPPNDRYSHCYSQTEATAINNRTGIWSRDEYALKQSTGLTRQDKGFRRIQGRVERIQSGDKALLIHMQGNVRIRIAAADLHNFDDYSLRQLSGKTIRVRGWIHPQKNAHFMALRHPSSLIIQFK